MGQHAWIIADTLCPAKLELCFLCLHFVAIRFILECVDVVVSGSMLVANNKPSSTLHLCIDSIAHSSAERIKRHCDRWVFESIDTVTPKHGPTYKHLQAVSETVRVNPEHLFNTNVCIDHLDSSDPLTSALAGACGRAQEASGKAWEAQKVWKVQCKMLVQLAAGVGCRRLIELNWSELTWHEMKRNRSSFGLT